jgi:hypothetical protein
MQSMCPGSRPPRLPFAAGKSRGAPGVRRRGRVATTCRQAVSLPRTSVTPPRARRALLLPHFLSPAPLAPARTPCPSRGRWWPPWPGDQALSLGPRFGAGYRGRGGSGRREDDTPEASRRTRRPQTSAELQRNEHAASCEGPERAARFDTAFLRRMYCRADGNLARSASRFLAIHAVSPANVRAREAFRGIGSPQRASPGSSSAHSMDVA